jgi:hypothetical protein
MRTSVATITSKAATVCPANFFAGERPIISSFTPRKNRMVTPVTSASSLLSACSGKPTMLPRAVTATVKDTKSPTPPRFGIF